MQPIKIPTMPLMGKDECVLSCFVVVDTLVVVVRIVVVLVCVVCVVWVITVFNEFGQSAIGAFEYYEKVSTINSMEATIYNSFGYEVKKIKRSDFKDQSASGEGTIYSDNRIVFMDYTPTEYPFTVTFLEKKLIIYNAKI